MVRSRVVTRMPLDLLDLAGEELALPAAHRHAPDSATREQEQVDAWHLEMSVRLEHHRCAVQPRRGPVRDDRVRRNHQAEAFDPETAGSP